MIRSLEEIYEEAQALPNESKIILAEKLFASVEDGMGSIVVADHLEEVKRRREEIRSGRVATVNGEKGSAQIRAMIGK